MATRMLIDARHPEETRVAVLKGNRIEEFDFESADRKQIKGNIYLAKVTRVEPSLQAAFVDFGGNRHGFLAFSEIHPDYYQIPKEDREALLAEEAAHAEEEAALRADEDEDVNDDGDNDGDGDNDDELDDGGLTEVDTSEKNQVSTIEAGHVENGNEDTEDEDSDSDNTGDDEGGNDSGRPRGRGRRRQGRGRSKQVEEVRARRMALRRRYKIQDVIQRRQVLLVQVVKEERGNKGAALTTYLSLAGRYCVLMPNSSHGGGISRKISSVSDRKRLKAIIGELNLPKSMGCIVRTAGLQRTKTEIKRDFDYLARLWDELREKTLGSSAPTLIHSDSDLVKRAIRDIYNRDIEEVVVEGEDGYKAAKSFMKLLMPSHARRVKAYADPVPLFQRYGAEDQLSAMYDPVVQLRSGGYIVINPTEALVSIDINSGRSTKEHGIEQTALNTNLEAAREIARQLRLRDMAGLVVIDFIDMEYGSNVRKVEKAMKDALKSDRARIQVGRISSFGLMEMSRQRLRTGVLEATTRGCPHCDGTGLVRTASSAGLSALRLIEDEAAKGKGSIITLYASTEAAVYLLNAKRSDLADIERLYGVHVEVIPEGENEGAKMRVASSGPRNDRMPEFEPIVDEDNDEDFTESEDFETEEEDAEEGQDDSNRRKRRKRRRGGRTRERRDDQPVDESEEAEATEAAETPDESEDETAEDSESPRKRRRRGGRRRRGRNREDSGTEDANETVAASDAPDQNAAEPEATVVATSDEQGTAEESVSSGDVEQSPAGSDATQAEEPAAESPPPPAKPKRTRRKKATTEDAAVAAAEPSGDAAETSGDAAATSGDAAEPPAKPKRTRRKKVATEDAPAAAETGGDATDSGETAEPPAKPKRTRRKKAVEPKLVEASSGEADTGNAKGKAAIDAEPMEMASNEADSIDDDGDPLSPRRGWWQRTFGN